MKAKAPGFAQMRSHVRSGWIVDGLARRLNPVAG
jgi:hypothetical protein